MVKHQMYKKLFFVLLTLLVGVLAYFSWYRNNVEKTKNEIQNELARLMPLKSISDSLKVRLAFVESSLESKVKSESQLKKQLKERDETILVLTQIETFTDLENKDLPLVPKDNYMYFEDRTKWYSIAGIVDSIRVSFTELSFRDSLTIAITKSESGVVYGYIQNHSPYNEITNAQFSIRSDLFTTQKTFWNSTFWMYASIIEFVVILTKLVL